jgi:hypothetical protein
MNIHALSGIRTRNPSNQAATVIEFVTIIDLNYNQNNSGRSRSYLTVQSGFGYAFWRCTFQMLTEIPTTTAECVCGFPLSLQEDTRILL